MKKIWILIPILIVWFLSQRGKIHSPIGHNPKTSKSAPMINPSLQLPEPTTEKKWALPKHHELKTERFHSPLGSTVIHHFSQNGVPIVGMEIRVKQEPNGLLEEENTYRAIAEIPIDRDRVAEQVLDLKSKPGRYDLSSLSADSLVILVRDAMSEGELAFATTAIDRAGTGEPTQLLIRVDDGKILKRSFGRREIHSKN